MAASQGLSEASENLSAMIEMPSALSSTCPPPTGCDAQECARLLALRRYDVLDTPDEEAFDRIVELARAMFDAPMAQVSLVDERRAWAKASIPDGPRETPRAWSFCTHAVQEDGVTVVLDARTDPRFRHNPFVVSEPQVRFYAGAPLLTPDGHALGTICVISPEPRHHFDEKDQRKLRALADIVMSELELRRHRHGQGEFISRLLETSSDCIKVLSLDGTLELMNGKGLAAMEVDDPLTCQGRPWPRLLDVQTRAQAEAAIAEAQAGRTARFEAQVTTRKGDLKWWDLTVSPILGHDGRPERLLAISHDVTERRCAERKARDGEAMFRTLAETIPKLVILTDAQGAATYANSALATYAGRPAEALLGDRWLEMLDPDDAGRVKAAWAASLQGTEPFEVEARLRRADGAPLWHLARGRPMHGEDGDVTGWVVACADIHAAVEAREVLAGANAELKQRVRAALTARREANALYRAYFRNSAEALFVVAVLPDGGFALEELNPAHEAATGLRTADVRGKRLEDQLPPEVAEAVASHYRRAVQTGEVQSYREVVPLGGETRHWDTVLVPVRDGSGLITRIVGSARDMTAQVKAQAELHQVQKLETIGQLTGGVAHDFNNLLTPILGALDIIGRRASLDERTTRLLDGAMQSAERAKTLVARLLAFARRQSLATQAVDVALLLRGMTDLVQRSIGPQVRVTLEAAAGLAPAKVDPNQLELAILNLAVNARDAMEDGGTLTITAQGEEVGAGHPAGLAPGAYVRLSVVDTGTGMDEATLARAVEPFFSTKSTGKGTGLGLSMVHGLAGQSGGRLRLSSTPGVGTRAEIWLPVADEPVVAQPTVAAGAQPARRLARILVVDDEELVRQATAEMLRGLGYEVTEAPGGAAAVTLVRAGLPVDLLVTDYLMPGQTGTALAAAVRTLRPGLPVLMVTGYANVSSKEAGHLPRLAKPFREADLAARVAELVEPGDTVVRFPVRPAARDAD